MNKKEYVKPRIEAIYMMQQQQLLQASGTGDIDTGNNIPTGGFDGPPVFIEIPLQPEFAL